MWNRFKIWLNKNDFKIITIVLIITGIYLLIKGTNSYFKNEIKSKSENYVEENTTNCEDNSIFQDTEYSESDFNELSKSDEDYKLVNKIEEKFINTIYKANKNNDESAKKDLVNMCSARWIDSLTTERRVIGTDNILILLMEVNNVNDYSIDNIYKYGEKNNVEKYIVNLKFDDGNAAITNTYVMFNVDKENKTFAFDGNYMDLDNLMDNVLKGYPSIIANGSNGY